MVRSALGPPLRKGLSNATSAASRSSPPPRTNVRRVGVVGVGQMGTGIGIVAAQAAKLSVVLFDPNKERITGAKSFMDKWLSKSVEKGKLSAEEKVATLDRVVACNELEGVQDVDFVIEAATEELEVKSEIFRELDRILPDDVVLATNTSSISITQVAAATSRADKVIGMHFFNPVPVMKVVELVPGLITSAETVAVTTDLAHAMQKQIGAAKDSPGFVSNRLLMPYINEAVYMLAEGVATRDAIDKVVPAVSPKPMGPLALADLIGLDTCLSIMHVLHRGLGDDKYRPSPLLVSYVSAGWLGRKSGRGFYTY